MSPHPIEPATPLASPATGQGEIQAGVLTNGFIVGGASWEQYVTDPGEHPNPADWGTEVYWSLAYRKPVNSRLRCFANT